MDTRRLNLRDLALPASIAGVISPPKDSMDPFLTTKNSAATSSPHSFQRFDTLSRHGISLGICLDVHDAC
jgi:hypothetical protein